MLAALMPGFVLPEGLFRQPSQVSSRFYLFFVPAFFFFFATTWWLLLPAAATNTPLHVALLIPFLAYDPTQREHWGLLFVVIVGVSTILLHLLPTKTAIKLAESPALKVEERPAKDEGDGSPRQDEFPHRETPRYEVVLLAFREPRRPPARRPVGTTGPTVGWRHISFLPSTTDAVIKRERERRLAAIHPPAAASRLFTDP
jgi:hypothetical protein